MAAATRVLTLGDGDLSYSVALTRALPSAAITATTFLSEAELLATYDSAAAAIAELRETEVVQLTPLWGRLSLPSRWTVLKDLEYGREDLKLSAWKVYTVLRDEKTPSLAEEKGASGFNDFIKSILKEPLGRYFCFVRDLIHPLSMGASFAIYGLSLFCAVLNEVLIPFFIFKSTGDGRILDQGVPTVHVVAYVIVTLTNVFVVSAMFSLLGVYIFALAQYDGWITVSLPS